MVNALVLKDFIKISNELDSRGLTKEADYLDELMFKQAGIFDTSLLIAQQGLAFVGSVASGVEKIGGLIEGTNIPGLAFVGSMIEDAGSVTNVATKLAPILNSVLGLISKKIEEAKTTGAEVCITLTDFDESVRDAVRLMLGLLAKASVGPALSSALNLGKKLSPYAQFIPGLSDALASTQSNALALGMCFGGKSDIPADANAVAKSIADQTEKNSRAVEQHANLIARNMNPPGRPGENAQFQEMVASNSQGGAMANVG